MKPHFLKFLFLSYTLLLFVVASPAFSDGDENKTPALSEKNQIAIERMARVFEWLTPQTQWHPLVQELLLIANSEDLFEIWKLGLEASKKKEEIVKIAEENRKAFEEKLSPESRYVTEDTSDLPKLLSNFEINYLRLMATNSRSERKMTVAEEAVAINARVQLHGATDPWLKESAFFKDSILKKIPETFEGLTHGPSNPELIRQWFEEQLKQVNEALASEVVDFMKANGAGPSVRLHEIERHNQLPLAKLEDVLHGKSEIHQPLQEYWKKNPPSVWEEFHQPFLPKSGQDTSGPFADSIFQFGLGENSDTAANIKALENWRRKILIDRLLAHRKFLLNAAHKTPTSGQVKMLAQWRSHLAVQRNRFTNFIDKVRVGFKDGKITNEVSLAKQIKNGGAPLVSEPSEMLQSIGDMRWFTHSDEPRTFRNFFENIFQRGQKFVFGENPHLHPYLENGPEYEKRFGDRHPILAKLVLPLVHLVSPPVQFDKQDPKFWPNFNSDENSERVPTVPNRDGWIKPGQPPSRKIYLPKYDTFEVYGPDHPYYYTPDFAADNGTEVVFKNNPEIDCTVRVDTHSIQPSWRNKIGEYPIIRPIGFELVELKLYRVDESEFTKYRVMGNAQDGYRIVLDDIIDAGWTFIIDASFKKLPVSPVGVEQNQLATYKRVITHKKNGELMSHARIYPDEYRASTVREGKYPPGLEHALQTSQKLTVGDKESATSSGGANFRIEHQVSSAGAGTKYFFQPKHFDHAPNVGGVYVEHAALSLKDVLISTSSTTKQTPIKTHDGYWVLPILIPEGTVLTGLSTDLPYKPVILGNSDHGYFINVADATPFSYKAAVLKLDHLKSDPAKNMILDPNRLRQIQKELYRQGAKYLAREMDKLLQYPDANARQLINLLAIANVATDNPATIHEAERGKLLRNYASLVDEKGRIVVSYDQAVEFADELLRRLLPLKDYDQIRVHEGEVIGENSLPPKMRRLVVLADPWDNGKYETRLNQTDPLAEHERNAATLLDPLPFAVSKAASYEFLKSHNLYLDKVDLRTHYLNRRDDPYNQMPFEKPIKPVSMSWFGETVDIILNNLNRRGAEPELAVRVPHNPFERRHFQFLYQSLLLKPHFAFDHHGPTLWSSTKALVKHTPRWVKAATVVAAVALANFYDIGPQMPSISLPNIGLFNWISESLPKGDGKNTSSTTHLNLNSDDKTPHNKTLPTRDQNVIKPYDVKIEGSEDVTHFYYRTDYKTASADRPYQTSGTLDEQPGKLRLMVATTKPISPTLSRELLADVVPIFTPEGYKLHLISIYDTHGEEVHHVYSPQNKLGAYFITSKPIIYIAIFSKIDNDPQQAELAEFLNHQVMEKNLKALLSELTHQKAKFIHDKLFEISQRRPVTLGDIFTVLKSGHLYSDKPATAQKPLRPAFEYDYREFVDTADGRLHLMCDTADSFFDDALKVAVADDISGEQLRLSIMNRRGFLRETTDGFNTNVGHVWNSRVSPNGRSHVLDTTPSEFAPEASQELRDYFARTQGTRKSEIEPETEPKIEPETEPKIEKPRAPKEKPPHEKRTETPWIVPREKPRQQRKPEQTINLPEPPTPDNHLLTTHDPNSFLFKLLNGKTDHFKLVWDLDAKSPADPLIKNAVTELPVATHVPAATEATVVPVSVVASVTPPEPQPLIDHEKIKLEVLNRDREIKRKDLINKLNLLSEKLRTKLTDASDGSKRSRLWNGSPSIPKNAAAIVATKGHPFSSALLLIGKLKTYLTSDSSQDRESPHLVHEQMNREIEFIEHTISKGIEQNAKMLTKPDPSVKITFAELVLLDDGVVTEFRHGLRDLAQLRDFDVHPLTALPKADTCAFSLSLLPR